MAVTRTGPVERQVLAEITDETLAVSQAGALSATHRVATTHLEADGFDLDFLIHAELSGRRRSF